MHLSIPVPTNFCPETKTLKLKHGPVLTHKDLALLREIVLATPRQVMANQLFISVKAVEKRISNVKAKLHEPGCTCYSVAQCLHSQKLTGFVLHHHNLYKNPR